MVGMNCGVSVVMWQNLRIQMSFLLPVFSYCFLDSLHSPSISVHMASRISELGCALQIERSE